MEIPKEVCECAFYLNRKVCSSADVIEKLKNVLRTQFNIQISNNSSAATVLEKAKSATNCDTESCILTHPVIVDAIGKNDIDNVMKHNFKPAGPALDYTALLNNFNIDQVLDQLAIANPEFYHIQFQMIDFAEQAKYIDAGASNMYMPIGNPRDANLATIDMTKKYREGFKCFGVVLNTDFSSGPGKHWFSIFIDLRSDAKPHTIEYFNSSGNMPMIQVSTWLADASIKLSKLGEVEVVRVTTERLQDDDYSCGIWALYYILSRLNKIPWRVFRNGSMNDSMMYEFRKHFFRHH